VVSNSRINLGSVSENRDRSKPGSRARGATKRKIQWRRTYFRPARLYENGCYAWKPGALRQCTGIAYPAARQADHGQSSAPQIGKPLRPGPSMALTPKAGDLPGYGGKIDGAPPRPSSVTPPTPARTAIRFHSPHKPVPRRQPRRNREPAPDRCSHQKPGFHGSICSGQPTPAHADRFGRTLGIAPRGDRARSSSPFAQSASAPVQEAA